jgi:hypothetical protein
MAITSLILSLNTGYTFALSGNPIVAVALSNQIAQPNFRYRIALYNTATTIQYVQLKADKVPTFLVTDSVTSGLVNYGIADLRRAVQGALGLTPELSAITNAGAIPQIHTGMFQAFQIFVNEEWGNPPVVATTGELAMNVMFIRGGTDQRTFELFDSRIFTCSSVLTKRSPLFANVQYNGSFFRLTQYTWSDRYLSFFIGSTNLRVRYQYVTANGSIARTFVHNTTLTNQNVYVIKTGYYQLSQNSSSAGISDGLPVNNSLSSVLNGGYIEVSIETTGGATISDPVRYYVDDCFRYSVVEVHWTNDYGGIDSHTFTLKNRKSASVTREQYSRLSNVLQKVQTKEVAASTYEYEWELNSNWLTDTEFEYVFGLIHSKKVWIVDLGQTPLSVSNHETNTYNAYVETNSHRFFRRVNDKLKSFAVRIKVANPNFSE